MTFISLTDCCHVWFRGPRLFGHGSHDTKHDLFGNLLYRRGDTHFVLYDLCLSLSRWAIEQLIKFRTGHRQAGAAVEVLLVQSKRAVRLQFQKVVEDQIRMPGLTVRR